MTTTPNQPRSTLNTDDVLEFLEKDLTRLGTSINKRSTQLGVGLIGDIRGPWFAFNQYFKDAYAASCAELTLLASKNRFNRVDGGSLEAQVKLEVHPDKTKARNIITATK